MRRIVLIATLVVGCCVGGWPGPASTLARQPDPSGDRDLPALQLQPADLAAAGLDGYGTGVGATGDGDVIARFDQRYRGGSADAPLLDVADIVQGSSLYLVRNDDLDLPSPDRVLSGIARFGRDDDARAAYDALVSARGAIADAPAASVAVEGGEATSFLASSSDPLGAATYRQASVVGLLDTLVVEVAVERTSDQPLSIDPAEALFSVEAGRIAGAAPDGDGLGNHTLDLDGSGIDPELSRYVVLDGESVPPSGQPADAAKAQAAVFTSFDAANVFQSSFRSADGLLTIGTYLSSHASQDDARAYVRAIPDLLGSTDDYRDVRVGNAIVPVGDSAIYVTYTIDGLDGVAVTELIFRSGSVVVELIVNAPVAASTADMTTLGRATAACLDAAGCPSLTIPDDVDPGAPG